MFDKIAKALREIGRDGLAAQVERAVAAKEAAHSAEVLELTSRVQVQTIAYNEACVLVAKMHEAAVGEVRGPDVGPVEDIAALKANRDELAEELKIARIDLDIANGRIGVQARQLFSKKKPTVAELEAILSAGEHASISPDGSQVDVTPPPDITAPSPASTPAAEAPAPTPQEAEPPSTRTETATPEVAP